MEFTTLISAEELEQHLGSPSLVLFDCRFDLADTSKGEGAYAEGHLPGAIYAHLDRQLSSPITASSGRHPLPEIQHLAQWLGDCGVSSDSQVVVYDDSFGTMATRLWWLLRWLGHDRVALLDGGWQAWRRRKGKIVTEIPSPRSTGFNASPRDEMLLGTDEILQDIGAEQQNWLLIDARTAERHNGEAEPIDPVAGSIPGSINLPLQLNVNARGRYLPAETLRQRYRELLGDHPSERSACYCGSGVTACHNLLAMEIAGFRGSRLYAGSWSEWIRDAARPVQTKP
ncbi:MAG: sulfurtransferase [Candidatus Sedimenticola sp. PURPLELP]